MRLYKSEPGRPRPRQDADSFSGRPGSSNLGGPATRGVVINPDTKQVADNFLDSVRRFKNRCHPRTAGYQEHKKYFWLRLLEVNLGDPRISDLIFWPGEYFGDGDIMREMTSKDILDTILNSS
jgi:hypothetical protein